MNAIMPLNSGRSFFRGGLQRIFCSHKDQQLTLKCVTAVFIFSAVHFQFFSLFRGCCLEPPSLYHFHSDRRGFWGAAFAPPLNNRLCGDICAGCGLGGYRPIFKVYFSQRDWVSPCFSESVWYFWRWVFIRYPKNSNSAHFYNSEETYAKDNRLKYSRWSITPVYPLV